MTDVKVPDIGDFKDVAVIEVLVTQGETIAAEQSLITVESDKASMEIPSPTAGVVTELLVKVGDKVSEGSVVLRVDAASDGGSAGAATPAAAKPATAAAPAEESPANASAAPERAPAAEKPAVTAPADDATKRPASLPHASPSIRLFARELGVDLTAVTGTGPKGRILREDVQGFVKRALAAGSGARSAGGLQFALPEWPAIDFAKFGPVETRPLGRIRKLSAANLHRNWLSIPHVTQHDEADITELEAFRREQAPAAEEKGFKLTLLAFLLKASVAALRQFPEINASLDPSGEQLIVKQYYHLGVAVDTPDGLVVPVLRDVDRKGLFDLAHELADISKAARDRKLKIGDLQGGTFSISSLGGIGGTGFTPIINAPEVAILGVSRAVLRPVYRDGELAPRLMLPLSLSYDHRVIDGAMAARFTATLAGALSDIRRTLL